MSEKIEEKKKIPYEELENVCHQLSDQAQTLYRKLQEANLQNLFKRLDYLFAVIENKDVFKDDYPEFYKNCIKEIVDSMTIPEEPTEPAVPAGGSEVQS